jgi:hypothetical protein
MGWKLPFINDCFTAVQLAAGQKIVSVGESIQ